ncbi:MAG TPA: GPW/gp25 family protein [Candidatus Acidoferrum sp.]|nr:GPW/gp25 family protein [Candidatus Acidoferrum sp.]
MDYLALPLALREGYLNRATMEESLAYSIGLILSTRTQTVPFYPEFGCEIWEKEYSDLYTSNKSDIRSALRNAIDRFEKRLYNVSVTFSSESVDSTHSLGIKVKVSGSYREDGEEKKFDGTYNIG